MKYSFIKILLKWNCIKIAPNNWRNKSNYILWLQCRQVAQCQGTNTSDTAVSLYVNWLFLRVKREVQSKIECWMKARQNIMLPEPRKAIILHLFCFTFQCVGLHINTCLTLSNVLKCTHTHTLPGWNLPSMVMSCYLPCTWCILDFCLARSAIKAQFHGS